MKNKKSVIVCVKSQCCMKPAAWAFFEEDYGEDDKDNDSIYTTFPNKQAAVDYYNYMIALAPNNANGLWQFKTAKLALEALENL